MTIQFLLDSQLQFQTRMGHNFKEMNDQQRAAYIKEHGYFLMEEVMEMFREMPHHKSWKDYSNWDADQREIQLDLMKDEAIDALHFMTNIFLALGMTEKEIIERYKEKNQINYERQENSELGYVTKSEDK